MIATKSWISTSYSQAIRPNEGRRANISHPSHHDHRRGTASATEGRVAIYSHPPAQQPTDSPSEFTLRRHRLEVESTVKLRKTWIREFAGGVAKAARVIDDGRDRLRIEADTIADVEHLYA
jgi:hypothetical protein